MVKEIDIQINIGEYQKRFSRSIDSNGEIHSHEVILDPDGHVVLESVDNTKDRELEEIWENLPGEVDFSLPTNSKKQIQELAQKHKVKVFFDVDTNDDYDYYFYYKNSVNDERLIIHTIVRAHGSAENLNRFVKELKKDYYAFVIREREVEGGDE